MINTHWHFDHTAGNPWLHDDGAELTAHENTRKHLLVPTTVTPWRYIFEPIQPAGRPTKLLKGDSTMQIGGERLSIRHVAHAHTDGDLMVRFEQADVLATDDIFWNGHYPFIDYETGGTIDGMLDGAKLALSLSTAKTRIVPGHGPVASKNDLQQYEEMLLTVRTRIANLKRNGRTRVEVIAAKPSAQFDAKYGDYAVAADDFVMLVYEGV